MSAADQLRRVRWIGGASGAGKSTVARRVAAEFGLPVYDTDGVMVEHAARLDAVDAPLLNDFLAMTMDQRWLLRSPTEMLRTFHWFAGEGFDLMVDDLVPLAAQRSIVAEGFRLLPQRVAPVLSDRRAAVWLLPSAAFRRAAFERRGVPSAVLEQTSEPRQALEHLLERDRLFTERLRADLGDLGLATIEVDVGDNEDDLFDQVINTLLPPEDE